MFGNLGAGEIIFILVIVLLVFGAKRLPEIGASMGKGIREFKKSINEVTGELQQPQQPPQYMQPQQPPQYAQVPPQQPQQYAQVPPQQPQQYGQVPPAAPVQAPPQAAPGQQPPATPPQA